MPAGPAAVMGDKATGVCTHVVVVPTPPPSGPPPLPHPYTGVIVGGCAMNVLIGGRPAAVMGATLQNVPPHLPTPPGTGFVLPPTNDGQIMMGSTNVLIGGRPAARIGDQVRTCTNSLPPVPGAITGPGVPTVIIGG